MAASNLPWTKGEERTLRELRARGVNNIEASTILKRTLSSVAAKVRQLGLPALPNLSPTQRKQLPPAPKVEPVVRAGKSTLPPLASLQQEKPC